LTCQTPRAVLDESATWASGSYTTKYGPSTVPTYRKTSPYRIFPLCIVEYRATTRARTASASRYPFDAVHTEKSHAQTCWSWMSRLNTKIRFGFSRETGRSCESKGFVVVGDPAADVVVAESPASRLPSTVTIASPASAAVKMRRAASGVCADSDRQARRPNARSAPMAGFGLLPLHTCHRS